MAVLLGPAGFGLMSMYSSIVDLAVSIAGMGVNSSGVRQIAESVGSSDMSRIARTVAVLRRTSMLLGLIGATLLLTFSRQVSVASFGTDQFHTPLMWLALAVFFRMVSLGQGALLQGMRRVRELAIMGSIGALLGSVISVALVYVLGADGVGPSVVAIAVVGALISWSYSRRVRVVPTTMSSSEVRRETVSLLKLGFAFMASGLLTMGAAYAVRTMVLRSAGLDMAGLYQAAWVLGGMYVGIILQAMGTDFYPRLTGVCKDDIETNRLVNEQARVSLLLAGPGVLATVAVAPLLMTLFYSAKFTAGSELLRWICLGMALRVITWPLGFIIVARGEQTIFFLTELAWAVVNVGLSWLCLQYFGVDGVGIAFMGSYVFHWLMIYPIVRRLSGFAWSAANAKTTLAYIALIACVFGAFSVMPTWSATILGVIAIAVSSVYSIKTLLALVSPAPLPPPILRLLGLFGVRTRGAPT